MSSKILLSIIIVHYKRFDLLIKCLESINLGCGDIKSYEIIVVDNDENKLIKKKLQNYNHRIIYLPQIVNKGYGAGINAGAIQAKGEYLLVSNEDVIFEKDSIKLLLQFNKKGLGIVSPLLMDEDKKPYELQGTGNLNPINAIFALSFINKIFPNNKFSVRYWLKNWNKKTIKKVMNVPGTVFLIKKEIFNKIGGFDNKFFLFFEEFDLCKRLSNKGYKVYITPKSKVVHFWKSSTVFDIQKNDNYFYKSRFYYFKKHFGLLRTLLVEIILRINFALFIIILTMILSIYFRFNNIENSYPFGGEQGLNYIELKNYYVEKEIPIFGPLTGRSWLKLSPLYYWIMMPFFIIFKWNPIIPAYFFAYLSIIILPFAYKLVKTLFDRSTALLTIIFLALSPTWNYFVKDARFYFINGYLSIFYFYNLLSFHKSKNIKYLYFSGLLYSLMINFHYGALALIFSFISSLLIVRTNKIKISIRRLFVYILIPQLPFIYQNIIDNFNPIIKTFIWIIYKIFGFFRIIDNNNINSEKIIQGFKSLLWINMTHFTYIKNDLSVSSYILVIVSIVAILAVFTNISKVKKDYLFVFISVISYIIAVFIFGESAIHYYVPILIVFTLFLSKLLKIYFGKLKKENILIIIFLLLLVVINLINIKNNRYLNSKFVHKNNFVSLNLQKLVSAKIYEDANSKKYSLKRIGEFDNYDGNYSQNYQYLLWFLGNEPVEGQNVVYTIVENGKLPNDKEKQNIIFNKYNIIIYKNIL